MTESAARNLIVILCPGGSCQQYVYSAYTNYYKSIGFETVLMFSYDASEVIAIVSTRRVLFVLNVLGGLDDVRLPERPDMTIWELYETPLLRLHVDPDYYYKPRAFTRSDFIIDCYGFEDLRHIKRTYNPSANAAYSISYGLPFRQGGEELLWSERDNAAVFVKTVHDKRHITDMVDRYPGKIRDVFWQAVALLGRVPDQDPMAVIDRLLVSVGIHSDGAYPSVLYLIARCADEYLRYEFSVRLARAIRSVPLILIGHGWNAFDWTGYDVTMLESVDAELMVGLFGQNRYVVNANSILQRWYHERVIFGLGEKSTVLSFNNTYCRETFGRFENYCGLEISDAHLEDTIAGLIDQQSDMDVERDKARDFVIENYGIERSARSILECYLLSGYKRDIDSILGQGL